MILQSPIKRGTWINGYHHELKDLADFLKCIFQAFGDHKIDYSFMGLVGHNGLDIGLENGDEVFASHDGSANFQEDANKGLGIVITTNGFKTLYWHLKSAVQPLNSTWTVKKGDIIGLGDSTGFSTGPHLHFGLKLLDNNGNVLNRDNGYDGAVDPAPYIVWFNMLTEQDVKFLQALEGYHDPVGVQYWAGKTLAEYRQARLPDKIAELNKVNE